MAALNARKLKEILKVFRASLRILLVFALIFPCSSVVLGQTAGQNTAGGQNNNSDGQNNNSGAQADSSKANAPAGVEVEVGIGSRIGGPKVSNYSTSNGTLSLTNLGRATPQFMTGLGFLPCQEIPKLSPCASSRVLKSLGAFVTVNFASGSNSTISGYTVGGTYALGSHLRLLAGFSLAPIDEVSPGFANAAAQYVTKNQNLFPGISPTNLATSAFGAFDGIQTTSTAPAAGATPTATIYYPGAITETHYRGGFVIGVAMSIDIYKLLGGGSNSKN